MPLPPTLLKTTHVQPKGARVHADVFTTHASAAALDSAARLLAEVQRGDMEEALRETSEGEAANDGVADTIPVAAPAPEAGR